LANLFDGSFFKKTSVLSDSDIKCLEAYNSELNRVVGYEIKDGKILPQTTSAQTAFNRTMLNASETAQNYAASANGAVVEIDKIPKVSKAAELGLKALSVAANALIAFAVTEVITSVVSSIQKHNQALEEARQKSIEEAIFCHQKSSMSVETKS
jgi:hypothetical protein